MKMKAMKRNYWIQISILVLFTVLIGIAITTVQYPKKMKDMFVQSSLESMEKKQNDAAVYIDDNVKMNYEEIRLLAGMISEELDGSENYSKEVLTIMQKTMDNVDFSNIGIMKMDSNHLFATTADGSRVQLNTWTVVLDYGENDVSIELQTSPFESADKGEDMVVYRYCFESKDGTEYMLIAEKTQTVLNGMLDIEAENNGLTMVIRNNGNLVYGNGTIEGESVKSYNVYALFQKLMVDDSTVEQIRKQMEQDQNGRFNFVVGNEMYYFMFHSIENTGWTVLNGYSETAMAGENLTRVKYETFRVVIVIAFLLIMALIFSVMIVRNRMQCESDRRALETENLFEEMSNYIPTSFAIVSKEQENPFFVSKNFYEILRQDSFDFTEEGVKEWCGDAITEEHLNKFLQNGKCELVVNKNERYISLGMYSIGKINGQNNYVLVFQDITDDTNGRKLLEDSMKRANTASESKTHFLSKMSHEIRTPLNSVIGFSTLAIDEWDQLSNEEIYDYMNKIKVSGNYLLELVSDILDVSRIEEGRMEINLSPCSLDAMVDEIADSFQGQMKRKNLQFVVDKNYEDVILNMDSSHTKQIMNNLISNAYKYTEEGGAVGFEINANQIEEDKMGVQFIVQDTGIGMTPEFMAKIFEPFTQEDRGSMMKKQIRGSGLGMSICKNLVEMQNGTIKVESEVGEGSCFTVMLTFEIAHEDASQLEENKENEIKDYSCLNGKKVLVVDDVEMNRILIAKMLERFGIVCEEAEDGKEALDKFAQSEKNEFFAIFMDVNMPVMNGYVATEEIRKLKRTDAKTIVISGLTADAFSDDVNKALMSGMNYHISKPVQMERLQAVLMETYEKQEKKGEA